MKTAIISVSERGDKLGRTISDGLNGELITKAQYETSLSNYVGIIFDQYDGIIFVSSTGIAVRSIASYLKGKTVDPAVVVVDVLGINAISLISGHIGGGNELCERVAELIGARAIITTATDLLDVVAPDMISKDNGLVIASMSKAKEIAAFLVGGERVGFIDEDRAIDLPKGYVKDMKGLSGLVYVTNKLRVDTSLARTTLKLIRKDYIIGIGCKANFQEREMLDKVRKYLEEQNIDIRSVDAVTTIYLKAKEQAIVSLASSLKAKLLIHSREKVLEIEDRYGGSDFVKAHVGVRAVCEPCVELSGGIILKGKTSLGGMTIALGKYLGNKHG